MKVKELMDTLKGYNGNLEVAFLDGLDHYSMIRSTRIGTDYEGKPLIFVTPQEPQGRRKR